MCSEPYINPPTANWIQCDACKEWCHEKCTNYNRHGLFVGDLCTQPKTSGLLADKYLTFLLFLQFF